MHRSRLARPMSGRILTRRAMSCCAAHTLSFVGTGSIECLIYTCVLHGSIYSGFYVGVFFSSCFEANPNNVRGFVLCGVSIEKLRKSVLERRRWAGSLL